jgi:hypothetical protein
MGVAPSAVADTCFVCVGNALLIDGGLYDRRAAQCATEQARCADQGFGSSGKRRPPSLPNRMSVIGCTGPGVARGTDGPMIPPMPGEL